MTPLGRRQAIALTAGALALPWAAPALAQHMQSGLSRPVADLLALVAGQAPVAAQGLRLQAPLLADNGLLVPVTVVADSPMTDDEHIRQIVLLATRNPVPVMARFHLGPWSGRAEVGTRLRLAGSQTIVAMAQDAQGHWRQATADIVVTESACVDSG